MLTAFTRATGLVLTSDKDEKHVILTTTTNFAVRRDKLKFYTLQNPLEVFLKFAPFWRLQGMCLNEFCLDGEVVFIHLKLVNKIGSSKLILVAICG